MRRALSPCLAWLRSHRFSTQPNSRFGAQVFPKGHSSETCCLAYLKGLTADFLRCQLHTSGQALYNSRRLPPLPKGRSEMREQGYPRMHAPPNVLASGGRVALPPAAAYPRQGRQPGITRGAKPAKNAKVAVGHRLPRPNLGRIKATRQAAAAIAEASGEQATIVKRDLWDEDALSHTSGMQLLFLGTGSGHPTESRRASCIALRKSKATWLFDCGEDTQRQVHKQPLVRQGKVDRIFITNSRNTNVLGLPGMLCTISASREIGLDIADVPLHVYGPPGLADFIRSLLVLSDTYLSLPVIVHEFVDHAVEMEQMENPEPLDKRSNLFRVLIPPDKLNPQGYYDGEIRPFLSRARRTTLNAQKGDDERANLRKLPLPPPGVQE